MSHASGAVRFNDGLVMFYEYNGTCDVCISHLYETMQGVMDNWRKSEWMDCNCSEGEEAVEVYSSYGGGFSFSGEACKKCKSLNHVGGSPFDTSIDNKRTPDQKPWEAGYPDWWKDIDPKKLTTRIEDPD